MKFKTTENKEKKRVFIYYSVPSVVKSSRRTKMKKSLIILFALLVMAVPAFSASVNEIIAKGDLYFQQAQYEKAMDAYLSALAKNPENPALRIRLEKAVVAKNADEFLSLMTREIQKRGDIRISAKALVKKMMKGEKLTLIDVRTPEEQALTRVTGALRIKMTDIMKNLDRIPTEGTVVIICHSSPRAIIVTTALRILGYNNVYALKGGIMAIANLNAKKVPDGLKPVTEGR